MLSKSQLRFLAAALTFCLACLDLSVRPSVGIPQKYLTGEDDPPTCDGEERRDPFPGQCGQRKGNFRRRKRDELNSGDIVGGRGATRGEFPWFADIDDCGATIVNDLALISAAHCFQKSLRKGQIVIAGSAQPMQEVMSSFDSSVYCGVQIRRIINVVLHPNFCSKARAAKHSCPVMYRGDIAIITVNRPFIFDAFVQRACLPDQEWDLNPGTNLVVVGNGFVDYDTEALSKELKTVEVPYVSMATCKKWLKGFKVTEDMFCAGFENGGKDACVGDSGGPILLPAKATRRERDTADDNNNNETADTDTATTLIGVVSWGVRCAEAKTPGVYARVDKALPWIQSQVKILTTRLRQKQEAALDSSSNIIMLGSLSLASVILVVDWW